MQVEKILLIDAAQADAKETVLMIAVEEIEEGKIQSIVYLTDLNIPYPCSKALHNNVYKQII